jgi:hypothetical protein
MDDPYFMVTFFSCFVKINFYLILFCSLYIYTYINFSFTNSDCSKFRLQYTKTFTQVCLLVTVKPIKFVATVGMYPPCAVTQTQVPVQNWPDLLRYHKRRQEVDIIDTGLLLNHKLKISKRLEVAG